MFLRATFESARARGAARDAPQFGSIEAARRMYDVRYHAAQHRYLAEADPEAKADIVVDNDDPRSPAIVRTASELERIAPHLRRTREFFAPRAASWDTRFPDDEPAYRRAVAELAPARGGTVIDLGCGTGRALPFLRQAVGPDGLVVGVDATPEMLRAAADHRRDVDAGLVLADATRLPVAPGRVDAIFAAGLLTHVPDPVELLRLLARVSSPQARLALFHPIGRAALAASPRPNAANRRAARASGPGRSARSGRVVDRIGRRRRRPLPRARVQGNLTPSEEAGRAGSAYPN